MAIIEKYYILSDSTHRKRKILMYKCECDMCGCNYDIKRSKHTYAHKRKIANGREICSECVSILSKEILREAGTKALKSFAVEQKRKYSSDAGKISATKENSGRFTKEKWLDVGLDDRVAHAKRASNGLQRKLENPEYRAQHFAKVFAQTKIGYMSKGHKDLHSFISEYGFLSHHQISSMQVDECNPELKIVVEYNGDMWHCNPRKWKADEYNSAIRMSAGEKWAADIARKRILQKNGYRLVVIWESDWQNDASSCILKIKELCDAVSEKGVDSQGNLLRSIGEQQS